MVVLGDRNCKSGLPKGYGRAEEGLTAQGLGFKEGFPEEVALEMSHEGRVGVHQGWAGGEEAPKA